MRAKLTIVAMLAFLTALISNAEDFLEFNHDGDDRALLIQEPIEAPLTIVCQIEIDELRHKGGSHPAIELWLTQYGGRPWRSLSGSLAVFAAFKTPVDKNFNYSLSTMRVGRDYSQGLEWYEAGERLTSMTFQWKDDGVLTFYVGDDESTAQRIHYRRFSPKFWSVTAARVRGKISCAHRTHAHVSG